MKHSLKERVLWRWIQARNGSLYAVRRGMARLRGHASPEIITLSWPLRPDRRDFLNALARQGRATSYLEIGCRNDDCFASIDVPRKVGVDPVSGGTVRATSDAFFAANTDTFDLIFVDGLHRCEQVVRDVRHALRVLNPGGVVVLHDCLPLFAAAQYRTQSHKIWNGDVWRAMVEIRTWPEVDAATCLLDQGLGIIVARPNSERLGPLPAPYERLPFPFLAAGYRHLLRTLDEQHSLEFARP
jgi:SAM-dependent methyltransferase